MQHLASNQGTLLLPGETGNSSFLPSALSKTLAADTVSISSKGAINGAGMGKTIWMGNSKQLPCSSSRCCCPQGATLHPSEPAPGPRELWRGWDWAGPLSFQPALLRYFEIGFCFTRCLGVSALWMAVLVQELLLVTQLHGFQSPLPRISAGAH